MSDIFDEIRRFEREMDLLLNNFMHSGRSIPYRSGWRPPVNIFERNNSLIIMMEAAGVKPENLSVVIERSVITISGKREDPYADESRNFYSIEISFGAFQRRISLPCEVDTDKAVVTTKDGFIQIVLPKVPSVEKVIKIE
jgi:HSP20 family protein